MLGSAATSAARRSCSECSSRGRHPPRSDSSHPPPGPPPPPGTLIGAYDCTFLPSLSHRTILPAGTRFRAGRRTFAFDTGGCRGFFFASPPRAFAGARRFAFSLLLSDDASRGFLATGAAYGAPTASFFFLATAAAAAATSPRSFSADKPRSRFIARALSPFTAGPTTGATGGTTNDGFSLGFSRGFSRGSSSFAFAARRFAAARRAISTTALARTSRGTTTGGGGGGGGDVAVSLDVSLSPGTSAAARAMSSADVGG